MGISFGAILPRKRDQPHVDGRSGTTRQKLVL